MIELLKVFPVSTENLDSNVVQKLGCRANNAKLIQFFSCCHYRPIYIRTAAGTLYHDYLKILAGRVVGGIANTELVEQALSRPKLMLKFGCCPGVERHQSQSRVCFG